jgi:hypothetical protein
MYVSNLSRDYIYKTFSQEAIFEAYGVPVVKGNFVSPLRRDKSPTCAFQYYGNTLRYYDNRPGEFCGDAISLVMYLKNLSFQEALLDIYKTLSGNITLSGEESSKKKKEGIKVNSKEKSTEIRLNFRNFIQKDLEYWSQYGISLDTLNKFNIKACKEVYIVKDNEMRNCNLKEEMCFAYLFPDNSVKVYFPERESYRFISNSRWVQGIEFINNPKVLVITKSLKDVMCLSLFNIQAVAMQGESILPPAELVNKYNCVYLADNDAPGKRAAVLIRKKYNIPIVLFPKEYREMGIKDFSDAYKILGQEKLKNILNKFYA